MDTLEVHVEQHSLGNLPPGYADKFPDSITVGQAVATWKEIIRYQKRNETGN